MSGKKKKKAMKDKAVVVDQAETAVASADAAVADVAPVDIEGGATVAGDAKPEKPAKSGKKSKDGKKKGKTKGAKRLRGEPTDVLSALQAAARDVRTALAAELSAHGLYAGQERVLLAIQSEPGTMLAEIANALGVKAPTVTKAVARLEAQGFVGRAPSQEDARAVLVTLTEQGENAREALAQSLAAVEKKAFGGMKKGEMKDLSATLVRISARVRGDD